MEENSICTSEQPSHDRLQGFSLIELLVGLALAMLLAAAVAPLWLSLQAFGARETDQTISALQGRVAVCRFERDLRLASASGCPFNVTGAVLEASPTQVIILERTIPGPDPILVEWEVVKGSLMRRSGACPDQRPSTYTHSRYSDNKTVLENLGNGSSLEYVVHGLRVAGPVAVADLASIRDVVLTLGLGGASAVDSAGMVATGRVGR